ncbi:hypothetical protein [Schleiferilactobacillus harbinensis]|uniref:Rgg family transcriptional regulator n=1 Tax=Schleiferilactobacillus harbinensis TaxID=304207 RepID=UPI00242E278C|nr:hypothetical protein [Schleiferilactobacillus harbinensis]MCI1688145.1 hypothetical protein [Schleiferilactobacillus harbinensis]MCI1783057.1 hypothetical protein [Schleiferilactobacillus harbinensis]MCI1851157.1 hypothetical protein [Schleiferilactobacillus harbinensis]
MGKKLQPLHTFYRHQRLAVHLSLTAAAVDVTTAATLSRFEMGKNRLDVDRFLQLLDVLPSTFTTLQYTYVTHSDITYYQRVAYAAALASTAERASAVTQLLADERAAYTKTGLIHHQLNVYDLIVTFNLRYPITPVEITAQVQAYLAPIHHFGLYELSLIVTMIRILPIKVTAEYFEKILSDPTMDYDEHWHNHLIWLAIANGIATAISHFAFDSAERIMALARHLTMPPTDGETKLNLHFYQLCLDYHHGHRDRAQARVNQLIAGLDMVGVPFYHRYVRDGWAQFLRIEEVITHEDRPASAETAH